MEHIHFNTRIYNECSSINKLLYSKCQYAKELTKLLSTEFGIKILQQTPKFGICSVYWVEYDFCSTDVIKFGIKDAKLYICRFKLQVKEKNGVEYINNILNDPIQDIYDAYSLEIISDYLFHNSNLPQFIVEEIKFDSLLAKRSMYALR